MHDVFISYNRRDAAYVKLMAVRLQQEGGLAVWMDTALNLGLSWRTEIETAMRASSGAMIAWGPGGLGPVQTRERDLAYVIRDGRPDFRVIYALLPGAQPPQGTWANVDTWVRFETSLDEGDAFARLVGALKGEAPAAALVAELSDEPAPYRGLAAFDADAARFFHGRDAEVREILERLAHHSFLAVVGPSGSGKTSLVQAGVLPRLPARLAPAAKSPCLTMRPGSRPLSALAIELARLQPTNDHVAATDRLLARLAANPHDLPMVARALLPPAIPLVLVVDRLEELYTLCDIEPERNQFIAAMLALAADPHRNAWVIATLRADFYGQLSRDPDLAREVVSHQIFLTGVTAEAAAQIIESPAAEVGAIFEKGLAAQVRTDASVRGEVSLPLLQHVLEMLWRQRRGRWLTWDTYRAVGGVAGALSYHAERVMESLGADERVVAQRVFCRLVWLEEGSGALASQRIEKAALIQQFFDPLMAERTVQRLADERLLVLRGAAGQANVELAHDTLPRYWPLLQEWVQQDQSFLQWRQRLRGHVTDWQRANGDEGALLRGTPLADAERWFADRAADLAADETEFVNQSIALKARMGQLRQHRRLFHNRYSIAGLTIGGALGAGVALGAMRALIAVMAPKSVLVGPQFVSYFFWGAALGGAVGFGMALAGQLWPTERESGIPDTKVGRRPLRAVVYPFALGTLLFGLVHMADALLNGLSLRAEPLVVVLGFLAGIGVSAGACARPENAWKAGSSRLCAMRLGIAALAFMLTHVVFVLARSEASISIAWGTQWYCEYFGRTAAECARDATTRALIRTGDRLQWFDVAALLDVALTGIVLSVGLTLGLTVAARSLEKWRGLIEEESEGGVS